MSPGTVAVVVKGYPRISETFIAHEIRGLEMRGLDLAIVSLRHPTDRERHPVHREIASPVTYLPEYLLREPVRVYRGWRHARKLAGYRSALGAWLRDLIRDPTPNRVRRFGQALVLARDLAPGVRRLHAHFIHTPASVARYAAMMRGLPWSCSAHAKDIWTTPAWDKAEKLADCDWVVTCSAAARDHLAAMAPDRGKVELIYHGLDPERFPPMTASRPPRDGASPDDPAILLSVGRAVEKKGLDVLVDALARLPEHLHWRLEHVGDGPLLTALRHRAERRGVAERIRWLGALPQRRVLDHYRAADLFVLPLRIARDGDRDGLPNVLLEAQSQGLACVAGNVAAAAELIDSGRTGVLVPANDAAALAEAIGRLVGNPLRRRHMGLAGREKVRAQFGFEPGLGRLFAKFTAPAVEEEYGACVSHSMPR